MNARDRPGGGLEADEVAELVHAVNNPLAAITMTADLLGEDVRRLRTALDHDPIDVAEMRRGLDEIGEAAENLATAASRLSQVVRQLHTEGAPPERRRQP